VSYGEAAKAIDWLCKAFGFEVQLRVDGDNGRISHAQLAIGKDHDGLIMLGDERCHPARKSPAQADGVNTQELMVFVDDVEAHCRRAREAGAIIVKEPATTDYGDEYWTDRAYEAVDHEGHHWYFVQRLSGPRKA